MSETESRGVVFFDGVCGLCNRFVDWLLHRDAEDQLRFAPLQGAFARKHLFSGQTPTRFDSLVFMKEGQILIKSDAVLACCQELGGGWQMLSGLHWVPRFLRDGVYDLVAHNRYQLFGRRSQCRLPTAEEKTKFFD